MAAEELRSQESKMNKLFCHVSHILALSLSFTSFL